MEIIGSMFSLAGAETKRAGHHPGAAAVGTITIPPAGKSARNQPPLPPLAVNQLVHRRDIGVVEEQEPSKRWEFCRCWGDRRQRAGTERSPRLRSPGKVNTISLMKGIDDDDNGKKLSSNLDSGHRRLMLDDLEVDTLLSYHLCIQLMDWMLFEGRNSYLLNKIGYEN